MATHSSILAWRIPLTEEPGGLRPIAPQSQYTAEATQHTRGTYCVVESPEVFGMEISCVSASRFSRCSGNHHWAASGNVRSERNCRRGGRGALPSHRGHQNTQAPLAPSWPGAEGVNVGSQASHPVGTEDQETGPRPPSAKGWFSVSPRGRGHAVTAQIRGAPGDFGLDSHAAATPCAFSTHLFISILTLIITQTIQGDRAAVLSWGPAVSC